MAGRPRDNTDPNYYNSSNYGYPSQPNLDYNNYALPSSSAAVQPTSSLRPPQFDGQRPLTLPHLGNAAMGSMGGPLTTTPQPWQQQGYMSSELGVDTRPHDPGDMGYPVPLFNGPIEAPNNLQLGNISPMVRNSSAGTQDVPRHFHQSVAGPVGFEGGNQPVQDSGSQLCNLQCGWIGCTNTTLFSREPDLVRHIRTQHIAPGAYNCKIGTCSKVCNRSDNLAAHMQRRH